MSLTSLCRTAGKPAQCSTDNLFPQARRDIYQRPIMLQAQCNASRNAALLRQKQCSSNGNVVSQFDAPLSSASSNFSEYGVMTSNCNIKSFFLWARRSLSFCCSVDFHFCLLVTLSTSVSLDKNFSLRSLWFSERRRFLNG